MNQEFLIQRLYQMVAEENVNIYMDLFNTTDSANATDPYWKESLSMFNALSEEHKKIFFKILKQIGIDTVSNILGLLDGVISVEGQDEDLILLVKRTNDQLNGDLQDLFLEYDENNRDL